MSKNIVIQEGGVGRQLTADKLKTALVGGGSCLWIPEDEANLGTKSITEDGTYEASSDGLYGFSSVTVRGIGKVTGTDPETGEETQITTDPTTGEIEKKVIPSSIRITTPPTRLVYNDEDLIDYAGMVVKAFLKSGAVFTDETYPDGIIPHAELDKPSVVDGGAPLPVMQPIRNENGVFYVSNGQMTRCNTQLTTTGYPNEVNYFLVPEGVRFATFYNGGDYYIVAMSTEDFEHVHLCHTWDGHSTPEIEVTHAPIQFPYEGKTYYYVNASWYSPPPVPTGDIEHNSEWTGAMLAAAAEIMFGENDSQTIPVNWVCPYGDNKTMTDSFTITVNPAPEPDPESGVDAVTGADPVGGGT